MTPQPYHSCLLLRGHTYEETPGITAPVINHHRAGGWYTHNAEAIFLRNIDDGVYRTNFILANSVLTVLKMKVVKNRRDFDVYLA